MLIQYKILAEKYISFKIFQMKKNNSLSLHFLFLLALFLNKFFLLKNNMPRLFFAYFVKDNLLKTYIEQN